MFYAEKIDQAFSSLDHNNNPQHQVQGTAMHTGHLALVTKEPSTNSMILITAYVHTYICAMYVVVSLLQTALDCLVQQIPLACTPERHTSQDRGTKQRSRGLHLQSLFALYAGQPSLHAWLYCTTCHLWQG
jgi:hypothetical protein